MKANQVKMTGVTGAYSYKFDELETMMTEVKEILKSGSITNDELRGVQAEIDRISYSLSQVYKLVKIINHITRWAVHSRTYVARLLF